MEVCLYRRLVEIGDTPNEGLPAKRHQTSMYPRACALGRILLLLEADKERRRRGLLAAL